MTNLKSKMTHCEGCGKDYNSHQSSKCPHPRFVDMTKDIREEIDLCLCGGLLLGEELYEEDGYYFLTPKGKEMFSKRIASLGLALAPEEFEVPENPYPHKSHKETDSVFRR